MKVTKLDNKKLNEEELRSNQNMHKPEDVHIHADIPYGVARDEDTAAQEHAEEVYDALEKDASSVTPKDPDTGNVKIPKNMYAEKIALDESLFTEDVDDVDKGEVVAFLKDSVEWLIEEDEGCSTYKLNDRLGICVGWQDGFDPNDEDVIHSNDEPTWAIVAGIKAYTSDDMRTDYDWINYPYFANGDTVDTSVSVSPNENYDELAAYFIGEFEGMKDWEIEKDGLVIRSDDGEEDAVEESCKGKKCSKKLKEGNNNKLMDAVKYAYGFTNKEAREWIRNATDEQKELIIKGFEDDAKKSFLNDSLKEDVSAFNLNDDVKDWYVSTFPDDELGAEIGERSPNGISFKFIAKLLDKGIDVYDFIPHDSVVRERIFAELAKRMGVEYDDVYDAWLNSDIRAKATELERRSAYKTLNGTENVYDVPKEYRGVLDKRFVKESLSRGKKLKEFFVPDNAKPYRVSKRGTEYYISQYDDLARKMMGNGNAYFDIAVRRPHWGKDEYDNAGLELKSEDQAKKTIDRWCDQEDVEYDKKHQSAGKAESLSPKHRRKVRESKELTEKKGKVEGEDDNVYQLVYDALFLGNKNFRPHIADEAGQVYDWEQSLIMLPGYNDYDLGIALEKEEDGKYAKAVADKLGLKYEIKPTSSLSDGYKFIATVRIPDDIANKDATEYVTSIGLDMDTIRPKKAKKK